MICDLCYREHDGAGELCDECARHKAEWDAMTPAERNEELDMMARHVAETEDRNTCHATHPTKGIRCEFDAGHSGPHAIGALPSARW